MRRVLVVAFHFPPSVGTGTVRVTKFCKYLPEFGWQPVVLTTNRFGALESDAASHVHRAGDALHRLVGRAPQRLFGRHSSPASANSAVIPNESWLGRLRDRIMVPDTKIGWFLPAVRLGQALIRRCQPQLIFSSSPPETVHLVARYLHQHSGLPWVSDLRDGWLFEPPQPALRQLPLRRSIESWLEASVVRQANAVVTATAPIAADFRRRYSSAVRRVETITNGFAEVEFAELSRKRPPDGTFRLVHTGGLAASRQGTSAEAFWDGLATLRSMDPATPLRVHFVGNVAPWEQAAAEARGLAPIVSFLPPVSRREALQHQLDADGLLLITAPGQMSVATLKLFDYIGAGVPILALAKDNAAAQIIEQYGFGVTVPPDNPTAIAKALKDMLDCPPQARTTADWCVKRGYFEWHYLTGQLSQCFDSIVK